MANTSLGPCRAVGSRYRRSKSIKRLPRGQSRNGTIPACGAFACMQNDQGSAQPSRRSVVASLAGAMLFCTTGAVFADGPLKFAGGQLEPVTWSGLAGWAADDHLAAFAAYQASCQAFRKARPTDDRGQIFRALWNVCRTALDLRPKDSEAARAFFEQNFQPVRIARLGEAEGLLTGYFEPVVAGSRFPSPEFSVPIYRRPRDLVADGYKPGSIAFPNKGVRISRRDEKNGLVPYYDRGAIESGALDGQKLEICWIKDPLDLVSIQIEGSARVILEDGTPLRISYDSHNGYPYSSIERALIERKLMSRKEVTSQRVRDWMAAHPDEAAKVRATNRSYTFFRVTGLSNESEPLGAEGVPLTPGRSIAVDRVHEYGTPFFIEAKLPVESAKAASPFGRLMIAQDTGSAIVGPARADLYWGAGDDAGRLAGRIHHPGRFVMLLPRELDLVAAGREMPLPVPKPKIAEIEVRKHDGKGKSGAPRAGVMAAADHPPREPKSNIAEIEASKQSGRRRTDSVGASSITDGRHVQALPPRLKASQIEATRRDAKGKAHSDSSGEIAVGRQNVSPVPNSKTGRIGIVKQDGKAKADSPSAGGIASIRRRPAPALKRNSAEIEVKKRDTKDRAASVGEDGRVALRSGRQAASTRKYFRSMY